MAKTNEEFRSDLAKEMRDKYKGRDEQLEQVEKSPFSERLKNFMRIEIMENFENQINEMKDRPGYEEAKKTHLEEIKAKFKLVKSKREKERLQREYEEKLAEADVDIINSEKEYEDAQIAHGGEIEAEKTKEGKAENVKEKIQPNPELFGNREKIVEDLKVNHVKVEENMEMLGKRGKKVYIDLPAVGNFEGFRFDYFISNKKFWWDEIKNNQNLQDKSHSRFDIYELLKKINEYMKEMGIVIDVDLDYTKDLNHWEGGKYSCEAGNCFKDITGLKDLCLLSDKDVAGPRQHTYWFGGYEEWDHTFEFYTASDDDDPGYKHEYNLFLKLD